ncbi:carbohydrate ABC transporter permease [Rhizobium mongolense]|uniref:Raffinose/stachyose/melibiose transport system permease protein n=3 Tax=Rhizobium mongolense TaxID=57676 RepID=A0A7W6WI16_9HYPH|nr:sugar ABC transporter permease [Rhizobium mongolense]MBB4229977.1 raffinose/stachyose/melibiose transport system permease protein [Rhizobium mongolense]MBB4278600.1 raffinose/stachyose/melibiose transport system permease protein [Rhizobium mongolense]TVZ72891.1 raffinose/stachyose/melibiose transport system permease protein [Rhizobium mongolense USDA 1844]SCW85150.1 raffinose/stachyose/melibiose transport system permease protein [Rhizobium mongolense subsp. loessense]
MANISISPAIGAARPARSATRNRSSAAHDRWAVLLLFLPPALLLFTLFVIMPMGEAAWYSLYKWNGYGMPTEFIALRNFQVLLRNTAFTQALVNNGLIILISIAIQVPLAIWLSTMLAHRIPGVVAFRLIFFLPYVLADVAAGLIWRFVYDGDYGLFAAISNFFGLATPYVLADKDLAIYAVLAVVVWKYFGFHMMLFIAGLQSVDKNVLEAAEIDGATGWQKFRYVTLPLLGSTLRLSIFFAVIGSLQLFDMIMPLTGGGPSNSTQTMVTFLYTYGVMRMQVGLGSAVGVVLFIICMTLAFGYKRIFMRND